MSPDRETLVGRLRETNVSGTADSPDHWQPEVWGMASGFVPGAGKRRAL
jgi:hypothetical protein